MHVLLSVDPGVHGCGVALWEDGRLKAAGFPRTPTDLTRAAAWVAQAEAVAQWATAYHLPPAELAIELPQVYVASRSKGDPNDLIGLASVVGAIVMRLRTALPRVYLPAEWKGQVPKEIVHKRAEARLEQRERICLTQGLPKAKSLAHNVLDAVAIGLVHLGRLG